MARPTRRIKCKSCKRTVSAIILESFIDGYPGGDMYDYQKVLIKDHRRSIFHRIHCSASGKVITVLVGPHRYR